MKKGLLLVVVMLATIAVKAQDVYVGGSLNVWRNSTGNTTSFKVSITDFMTSDNLPTPEGSIKIRSG